MASTSVFWCVIALFISVIRSSIAHCDTEHKYLLVGAGPGSLQMAHYLESAGRDYLVLEATSGVASFFRKYPRSRPEFVLLYFSHHLMFVQRWRTLISLNKRHTGKKELDHNLRHGEYHALNSAAKPISQSSFQVQVLTLFLSLRLELTPLRPITFQQRSCEVRQERDFSMFSSIQCFQL